MTDRDTYSALECWATDKLDALVRTQRLRSPRIVTALSATEVEVDGQRLVNVSGNDYLGLAQDERLKAAAQSAVASYGAGASASPLVTGRYPLLADLETAIAHLKEREEALVFSSGYQAALGVIPALMGPQDLILIDERAHNCLFMGAKLSGAKLISVAHNEVGAFEQALTEHRSQARHCLIVTDSIYSMDGDLAPLEALADLAHAHGCWTLSDEAHASGLVQVPGVERVDILTGTLSKALGAQGGFAAASHPVIHLLRNRARSHIYATALTPAAAGAALEAITIIRQDDSLGAQALAHARIVAAALDLPAPQSAILAIILGSERVALDAQANLEARGFLAVAIRPPTVPEGTGRLRLSLSAAHSQAQVTALIDALKDMLP